MSLSNTCHKNEFLKSIKALKPRWCSLLSYFLLLSGLMLSSCSVTKTVPEGELLYTGSEIEFEHPDSISHKDLKPQLQNLFAPRANRAFLGLPIRLWLYNLFESEKEKGLIPWLQKTLGEPPTLYEHEITESVAELMRNQSFNLGYYDATVEPAIDTVGKKRKKAKALYKVRIHQPYFVDSYTLDIDNERVREALADIPSSDILGEGQQYNLLELRKERERISEFLRRKGYYFFDPDYLVFKADSVSGYRDLNLRLKIKDEIPASNLQPVYLDEITVYPSFNLRQPQTPEQMIIDSVKFAYDTLNIRPAVLLNALLFRPGDRYNVDHHQRTRERLLNLPFYQFVNLRFNRSQKADSLINLEVFLTPRLPNTIEGAVGGSYKSSGFIGPEINLTYLNRNLFNGSELLRISGNANFNFPLTESAGSFYDEYEGNISLTRPGLLLPFLSRRVREKMIGAGTTLQLGFLRERARFPLKPDSISIETVIAILDEAGFPNLADQLRSDSTYSPFVGVNEFEFTFGYNWRIRKALMHEVNPLHFRFQQGTFDDPELEVLFLLGSILIGEPERVLNLERMFIYQPEYIFTFDSRLRELKRDNYFFRGRIAYAGNEVIPTKQDAVPLDNLESQFIQLETDGRYFLLTEKNNTLATRLLAYMSLPMGKELILPFFDFYSVGGPNSVRAFSTREIGPGTSEPRQGRFSLLSGLGDIRLEANVEYRQQLNNIFEIGYFLDAGNVWLFSEREGNEDEKFEWNDFYKEIAVGAGAGLRLNISGLIIRLDVAIPLTKPWLPLGERWVLPDINFGDPKWRRDNITWHLAFGYPF